jgi:hypothetical protein
VANTFFLDKKVEAVEEDEGNATNGVVARGGELLEVYPELGEQELGLASPHDGVGAQACTARRDG